jgi:L-ascorbate metabolism protein UlaG (beta-lactamase superfamily)
LDAVIISHDHYDHLDASAIRHLQTLGVPFITSLGVGASLEKWGVAPELIVELDWGDTAAIAGLMFRSLPARHYSGRGLFGGRSFWSGWAMRGQSHAVYYSGDTGWWDDLPASVGSQGPFDLTLIKIGSYGDYWPDVHLTPEQAVRLHKAINGAVLLPVHWGTFNLAHHAWDEPAERLLQAAAEEHVSVVIPRPGEMVEPASAPPPDPWWRSVPNAARAKR